MVGSHGRFVWYELITTDVAAAKAFYTKVIGWGAWDASPPGRPYTFFTAGKCHGRRADGAAGRRKEERAYSRVGSAMSASTTWTLPPTGSSAWAGPCMSRRRTLPTSAAFRSSPTRKPRDSRCSSG